MPADRLPLGCYMARPAVAMDFARALPVAQRMRALDHLARSATGRFRQDGIALNQTPPIAVRS